MFVKEFLDDIAVDLDAAATPYSEVKSDEPVVPLSKVVDFIEKIEADYYERLELLSRPIKKFLFVEDGSVDVEELENELAMKNPEIKMIVYRQGSCPPKLLEVKND